jgi:hypothetical protein
MVEQHQEDQMKLTSIGLMAGGLMLPASCVMAANTFTTGPSTGIGEPAFQSQGLLPETPEQSTGLAPGTLRQQSPVEPNSSGVPPENSVLPQNSTGGTPPPNTGG